MAQYQGGKTFTLKRYGLGAELSRIVTALTPVSGDTGTARPRIFDLTCGSGVVLQHFANTCPGRELIGSGRKR